MGWASHLTAVVVPSSPQSQVFKDTKVDVKNHLFHLTLSNAIVE